MKGISEKSISEFKRHLHMEEKAEATIEKYLRDIRFFSNFLGGRDLTKETGINFKQYLIIKGYAVRSINSMIASLNAFFGFLGRFDCKLKTIKLQKQIYCTEEKELSKAEYMRLISTAKRMGNNRLSLIIETIGATGIRISELQYITVEAVKESRAIVSCKGKIRTVFIVKELKKKLLRYIAEKRIKSGCVFVTKTGRSMSRCNVWREMKKICSEAKVNPEKVFPHNLRHLFARVFYNIKKDIAKLADVLGHSSINTTRIYIITTGLEHRKILENMRLTT